MLSNSNTNSESEHKMIASEAIKKVQRLTPVGSVEVTLVHHKNPEYNAVIVYKRDNDYYTSCYDPERDQVYEAKWGSRDACLWFMEIWQSDKWEVQELDDMGAPVDMGLGQESDPGLDSSYYS